MHAFYALCLTGYRSNVLSVFFAVYSLSFTHIDTIFAWAYYLDVNLQNGPAVVLLAIVHGKDHTNSQGLHSIFCQLFEIVSKLKFTENSWIDFPKKIMDHISALYYTN